MADQAPEQLPHDMWGMATLDGVERVGVEIGGMFYYLDEYGEGQSVMAMSVPFVHDFEITPMKFVLRNAAVITGQYDSEFILHEVVQILEKQGMPTTALAVRGLMNRQVVVPVCPECGNIDARISACGNDFHDERHSQPPKVENRLIIEMTAQSPFRYSIYKQRDGVNHHLATAVCPNVHSWTDLVMAVLGTLTEPMNLELFTSESLPPAPSATTESEGGAVMCAMEGCTYDHEGVQRTQRALLEKECSKNPTVTIELTGVKKDLLQLLKWGKELAERDDFGTFWEDRAEEFIFQLTPPRMEEPKELTAVKDWLMKTFPCTCADDYGHRNLIDPDCRALQHKADSCNILNDSANELLDLINPTRLEGKE